jgi:Fe-S-cluster containining protein
MRPMSKASIQPPDSLASISLAERQAANQILAGASRISQVVELVNDARRRLTELLTPFFAQMSLACRPGCAWCCHRLVVLTTIPEVLVMAEHLRRKLTEAELAELRRQISAVMEQKHRQSRFQPVAPLIPCPLLVDNLCSVYEVRPLVCWAWHASDVRRCQRPNGLPAPNPAAMQLFSSLVRGLLMALADQKLENDEVELVAGLDIALYTPQVTRRWLAGEILFGPAAAPPVVARLAA